jgi:catechol 2,3-dioxygenase
MKSDSEFSPQQEFRIDSSTKIGYVSLNVSDLQKSIDFYKSVLGFKTVGKTSSGRALLSGGDPSSHLVELLQTEKKRKRNPQQLFSVNDAGRPTAASLPPRAGLYHLAILLPERKYLADMLLNLRENRGRVHFDGLADHLVSEAIYIRDPDLNGVEIYSDRNRSEWKWSTNRRLQMATLPLNTNDLLKEATELGWIEMPAGTRIGHVHLHVRDLAKAMNFYNENLGLNLTTTYPGACFFAANGYHHHIATNTWLGSNVEPASPEDVGLNHFSIKLPNRDELEKTMKHLENLGVITKESEERPISHSVFVHDFDGIRIKLQHE